MNKTELKAIFINAKATDVVIEEQEFAESKRVAGEQAENAGYSDAGDGFMNIPDGIDGELPFM